MLKQKIKNSLISIICFVILICYIIIPFPVNSQSKVQSNTGAANLVKNQPSKIYFYHKDIFRLGKAKIFCNEILVDKIARGTILALSAEPGQYRLQTDLKKDGVLLQTEPTKEYYIDISPNFMFGGYYIKKADPSEVRPFMKKLPEKKKKEILFANLKSIKKKPSKSFLSQTFIKYLKYSSIVAVIIAFIIYIGIVRAYPDSRSDDFLFISVIIFLIIEAVFAGAYYPVLYISKTGWKFLSFLFHQHFLIGVLIFIDFLLNIWIGLLINTTRSTSGAYEKSDRGYWATKDGKYYMSAKKWETGEWTAPMKAVPRLILWNLFILFLSFLSAQLIVNHYPGEIRFFLSYSLILFLLWLFYFIKFLRK